ncbi:uncharacterized protein GIQ15_02681 [Arthroderma uncinatum]|uniref:uncharacterized protein n=1 Tax=Arthroderma uncinatum TaxID=74035 RepID=UPI00144A6DF9|nr:uncharacterized protein GIQ15_02681 [Arthroderma uncinatum]KAF3483357.1 hypothetical protein GIQ15_02681 [Arthroderma uncinatum]
MRAATVLFSALSLLGLAQASCPEGTTVNCCIKLEGTTASTCAQPGATYCQEPGNSLLPVCCKSYSLTPRGYVGTECTKLSTGCY